MPYNGEKMKIAVLVPLFPPMWLGGTEIATWNIARHLTERRHDVHVVTLLDRGLPKESVEDGFHIHRIALGKVRWLEAVWFWLRMFWLLRRMNPDVVHIQSINPFAIPAVLARKFLRKPYVVCGRGSDVYLPWRRFRFKKPISSLLLKNASIVIALTEDMRRAMRKICDRDIIVVPNGIDLEQFENLSRKRARSELQIEEQEKVILFVGKLLPVKGVQYLIQAMDIIRRREADARLLLVGDGDQRDCLRSLVKQLNLGKHVTFVGWVSNEKVPKYMAASDVFVLPSLSEGFALVILEAMASGLPIVATRVGGLPDIVKERRNGFLVEPRSPMEIAEKILLLSADGELRRRFSRNNKRKVKAYSWPAVVTRIEEIYLSCLSAKA